MSFPSPSVLPFLGSASSRGQDWLLLFWLPARWGSGSLLCCQPRSSLRGVISSRGAHWSSCDTGARCPSLSNVDTHPEVACPEDGGCGVAALRLRNHSRIVASALLSTGGRLFSSTGGARVRLSRILVAVVATPRATVSARSSVALALGATRRMSGPPGAMLRPSSSIAVSVSVCVLRGEPGVSAGPQE